MKKLNPTRGRLLGKTLLILFSMIGFMTAFTVEAQTQPCVKADFEFAVDNNTKTAKFESRLSSNVVAVKWDFGNGKTATTKNAATKYDSAGYYKVCLTAYGFDSSTNSRCSVTVCKRLQIIDCNLKTEFKSTTSDLTGKFEARANSNNAVFVWSFGDGQSARGKEVKHTYSKEGKYTVCVVARDTVNGCVARYCDDIKVEDPCQLAIDLEWKADGLSIKAEGKSNSRNAVYSWSFGDKSEARGREVKHTYKEAGKYTLCLYVKDTVTGCKARKCVEIRVGKVCDLKVEFASKQDGRNFVFEAQANERNVHYVWTFGDGDSARGQRVKHQYNKPGTYEVCVKAIKVDSTSTGATKVCTAKACKRVEIKADCTLKGDFALEVTNKKLTVKARANEDSVLYYWSFGDGTSGHGQKASHQYRKPGTYEVCLIIFNPKTKCKVMVCKRVVIEKPCRLKGHMTYRIDSNKVYLKGHSNSNTAVYGWTFGDGTAQRGQRVSHTYAKSGTYVVTLIIKDTASGCELRVKKRIMVPNKRGGNSLPVIPMQKGQDDSRADHTAAVVDFGKDWSAQAYPVPANTRVDFTAEKDLASVKVFNSGGTEVLKSSLKDSKTLDITTLPTGYYFAHLQANDGSVKIVKFVKN